MNADRALEIIAGYGADARRWPDGERDAVAALAAGDPAVAAAITEARQLDLLLGQWAADVAPAGFDATTVTAATAAPAWPRWFAGGAMVASLAAGLTIFGTAQPPVATAPRIAIAADAAAPPAMAAADAAGFDYVFTPTIDEDELI